LTSEINGDTITNLNKQGLVLPLREHKPYEVERERTTFTQGFRRFWFFSSLSVIFPFSSVILNGTERSEESHPPETRSFTPFRMAEQREKEEFLISEGSTFVS